MPLDNLYAFCQPRYENRSSIILNLPETLKGLSRSSESCPEPQQFRAYLLRRRATRAGEAKPFPKPPFVSQDIFALGTCAYLLLASRSSVCGTRRFETCPTGAAVDSLPGAECLPHSSLL